MTCTVLFAPSADRDLKKIADPERARVIRKVAELARDPRPVGVSKLTGVEDLYRIRIGEHRVIYQIADRTVTVVVVRVRHRRDAYRP